MASTASIVFKPRVAQPPPPATTGVVGWLRENLFYSIWSTLLTAVGLYVIYTVVANIWEWGFTNAVFDAASRRECLDTPLLGSDGQVLLDENGKPRKTGEHGACWAGVTTWFRGFMYGRYPLEERWRVNMAFITVILWMVPLWIANIKGKASIGVSAVLIYPFFAAYLFSGGDVNWFWRAMVMLAIAMFCLNWIHVLINVFSGLSLQDLLARLTGFSEKHESTHKYPWLAALVVAVILAYVLLGDWEPVAIGTNRWGGLFLTLVIAGCAIVFALPGGIVLALARRSTMPFIRIMAITFIELFRSVPLITVLFMAVTMFPLFLPEGTALDKLIQAIVGVCLFASAYMAETVRGGLQAIPKGQYEAAQAMGLTYWKMMNFIILPQALKLMIPNIVGSFISLFKDTTLVSIIGLYDMLLMMKAAGRTPQWIGLHKETLFFGAVIYFVFCFAMSRYSQALERKLHTGH
jgi:general L-amino acid transport system permease protein